MKKLIVATAVALSLGVSGAVSAADGIINITGEVSSQTCKLEGGNSYVTKTVNLPMVSATSLAQAGDVSGRTRFSLALTECTGTSVQTLFEVGPTVDSATGNLINQVAGGSSAQVQFLNDAFQAINLSDNTNSQVVTVDSGNADMVYYAQYYASTANTTAGQVSSSIEFTMIYN